MTQTAHGRGNVIEGEFNTFNENLFNMGNLRKFVGKTKIWICCASHHFHRIIVKFKDLLSDLERYVTHLSLLRDR